MRRSQKILSIFLAFLCLLFAAFSVSASPYTQLERGGSGGWLNVTRPLTEDDFKGKAVLLDFWTYGCINCMQIIPDLEYLEKKFGNKLLIIGVHSAKFEGESGNSRILFAAKRFGLKHPVINDADFVIWKSYGVNAWPTQILLGPDGQEVARWSGEGHRSEIENAISKIDATSQAVVPLENKKEASVLSFPSKIEVFGQSFVIADTGHNRLLVVDKTGKILYKIGSGTKGDDDGSFTEASFNAPHGIAVSGQKIYVADTGNHKLRMIDLDRKTVVTLAGNGKRGSIGKLASPWDLVFIGNEKLTIANAGTHQILVYDIEDKDLSVLAGSGREDIIDASAEDAALAQPSGLSFAGDALYFVDAESSSLRVFKDGKVRTLVGTGLFDFGLKNGTYPKARMQHAQGLDAAKDKIYIADTYNNVIRVYDQKTAVLSTLPVKLSLNEPGDILVTGQEVYIVDTNNNAVHKIDLTTEETAEFQVQ